MMIGDSGRCFEMKKGKLILLPEIGATIATCGKNAGRMKHLALGWIGLGWAFVAFFLKQRGLYRRMWRRPWCLLAFCLFAFFVRTWTFDHVKNCWINY